MLSTKDILDFINSLPFEKDFLLFYSKNGRVKEGVCLNIPPIIAMNKRRKRKTISSEEEMKILSTISEARESDDIFHILITHKTLYDITTGGRSITYVFRVDSNTRKIISIDNLNEKLLKQVANKFEINSFKNNIVIKKMEMKA